MSEAINIIWLKRDLRLSDHEPLYEAAAYGPIVALYIVEPTYWKLPDSSRRHWCFIHDCLAELTNDFKMRHVQLVIRVGDAVSVFESFRQQFQAIQIWSHEETGNHWTYQRDLDVGSWCKENHVTWNERPTNGVVRRLQNRDGWAALRNHRMAKALVPVPLQIRPAPHVSTDELPSKQHVMFGEAVNSHVQIGGRQEGLRTLNSFLQTRAKNYMTTISKPGVSARHCSRLSAHLAFGSVSAREVEHATQARILDLSEGIDDKYFKKNLRAFLSRLAWRCHFVQKLEQQPEIEFECMHKAFEGMREPHFREDYFAAWKTGHTGYPLVDACMRSLHANGWINFRMRAMLVSFASYNLWLDWRQTAPFLAQLFTDYEPGIHYSQFQMQSGVTGINAVRMYSPVKQSIDQDPEGKFIKRYVPELVDVPPAWIHEPWRMPSPPTGYPPPIVDHDTAIKHARTEISKRWHGSGFKATAQAVNQKLGSRQKQPSRKAPKPKSTQMSFDL
jgi:deoxyribodipyrimidine photo-lyase